VARSTLIIVGPGGIGKSPIDDIVRRDVVRLDPYRLRNDGPRDNGDRLYAPPKIRQELAGVFRGFGDIAIVKKAGDETVEWHPRASVVFFTVRGEWQCIIVPNDMGTLAKMEIYAPVLPTLMIIDEFVTSLGAVKIVVLNPASKCLSSMSDWKEIEERTRYNCERRGDLDKSVKNRVKSVASEAPYWRELVEKDKAIEAVNWQFPEYIYKAKPDSLEKAKQCLLGLDETLGEFF
jgi:hypothetical protein